ncbi:MAG: GDSL-type esterase/lipase family protein [Parvibaculum sp.]|uniref:GDSL-type esterase/lipase family protein n=1 Tax=Parvibaculum sp. TaxID=2024848 RepID=UPI002ABAA50E|nr:GDSL-type esterase/lipase family protein [Parvibaculum sp.]MDZ4379811.1 GDSL-type esterase/lipase family protein [Parvibaculum sp.]
MTGSGSARQIDGYSRFLRVLIAALAIAAVPSVSFAARCVPPQGLDRFHEAIGEIEANRRSRPLTILHLGDSHISLDNFTRGLRKRWQEAYGDAGRGLMPGVPFRYYAPDGFDAGMSGAWDVVSSLPADASGPFGMQGFRVSSGDAGAVMTLRSEQPLTRIEIDAYGGPGTGALLLKLGDAAALKLQTHRDVPGLVRLSVPAANVHNVRLSPAGSGAVHLLGWNALSSAAPGVRYDSFGVVAATASITERWDANVVRQQIAALKPDLVILGYGTNEGYNNGLDLDGYRRLVAGFIRLVETAAPDTSIALLGPFDGARQGRGAACGEGWATPPNLDGVRGVLRRLAAARGAFFWDGGAAMGGACAADAWARTDPPLMYADRVHLRPAGAERLSAALWAALMEKGQDGASCEAARRINYKDRQ